jgi:hypothetical protein
MTIQRPSWLLIDLVLKKRTRYTLSKSGKKLKEDSFICQLIQSIDLFQGVWYWSWDENFV